eukprot:5012330-Prymnesium_polylepis.1
MCGSSDVRQEDKTLDAITAAVVMPEAGGILLHVHLTSGEPECDVATIPVGVLPEISPRDSRSAWNHALLECTIERRDPALLVIPIAPPHVLRPDELPVLTTEVTMDLRPDLVREVILQTPRRINLEEAICSQLVEVGLEVCPL